MATTTPLTQQFLIDKWFIARTLQVVLFGLSLGIGTACFFNLYPVNEAIFGIQLNVNVPITSAWISRVSNTYNEFAGLSQVLQFAWLSTFVMILANLLVAMPELRRNKLSGDIIVRSPIHKRLYHNWFRMTPWSSKKKILASDEAADLALAKMDTRHLVQRPAVFYVFGTVVVLIYFSATSDAG
ncbi:MAG: hypothetical protein KJ899_07270, partial [Gammaproteobacteria bacterium]|nr:hypothetical protein [Gammaproteobacteria bacterium]